MIMLLYGVGFCAILWGAEFLVVEYGHDDDVAHFRRRWNNWY